MTNIGRKLKKKHWGNFTVARQPFSLFKNIVQFLSKKKKKYHDHILGAAEGFLLLQRLISRFYVWKKRGLSISREKKMYTYILSRE